MTERADGERWAPDEGNEQVEETQQTGDGKRDEGEETKCLSLLSCHS